MYQVFITENVSKKVRQGTKQFNWLMEAKTILQENPFAGDQVSRRLTPRIYKRNFSLLYVYRYPVPEAHRIIYFIDADRGLRVIISDLLNHTDYERMFKY